jgi:hypothetical protein
MSEEEEKNQDGSKEVSIRNHTLSVLEKLRAKVVSMAKEHAERYSSSGLGKKLTESGSISVSFTPSWNPTDQVLVVGVKFGFPRSTMSSSNNMEVITSIMSGLCFPAASSIEESVISDSALPFRHLARPTEGDDDAGKIRIHIFASAAYYDHFPSSSSNQTGYDPELLIGMDSVLGPNL